MKTYYAYVIPALASIALTATVALAQISGPAPRMGRTPPTAAQMAARQAQFCADREARQAAHFTYTEERLKLTAAQKPLFDRWKAAVQSVDAARQANCGKPRTRPAASGPTLTERNARTEDLLKQRLANLEKTNPPEEALYNALTADQKALFEHRGGKHNRFAGRGFRMAFAGHEFGQDLGQGFGRGPGRGFGPRGPQHGAGRPLPPASNGG